MRPDTSSRRRHVTARRRLGLLGGLLLGACRFSDIPGFQQPQIPLDTTRPRPPQDIVAWLRDSSAVLPSLLFEDTAWRDLEPLRRAIGSRRVVLLGEQSGGDGTTLRAKARLVRYLHEQLGFDVLVMEGGVYDLAAADTAVRALRPDATTRLRAALPAPWRNSAELTSLWSWLAARARSGRPLRLAGIDPRFTSAIGANADAPLGAALERYLRAYGSPLPTDTAWPALRQVLDDVSVAGDANPPLPAAARAVLERGLPPLRLETNRLVNSAPEAEAAFWRSVVSALQVREQWVARLAAGHTDTAATLREAEMADALVATVQSVHRGRRVIVWTTSTGARRASTEITSVGGTAVSLGPIAFGEQARTVLGDDAVYHVGFLAARGTYGPFATGTMLRPLVRPTPESWDGLFLATGHPNAFVDLRRTPTADNAWLFARRVARPFGYQQLAASWPQVFDGFFFTTDMAPVTTVP